VVQEPLRSVFEQETLTLTITSRSRWACFLVPTSVAVLKEQCPLCSNLCLPVIPSHMKLIWCKIHEPIVVSTVAVPRKHGQRFIVQGEWLLGGPLTEGVLQ
jgi:hypothetical protein